MKKIKRVFTFVLSLLLLFLINYFFVRYIVNNAIFDFNCKDNRQIILKLKEINLNYSPYSLQKDSVNIEFKKNINDNRAYFASADYADNIADRLQEFGINDYKIEIIGNDKIKLNFTTDDSEDNLYINRLLLENCNFSLSCDKDENDQKTLLINQKLNENAYINVSTDYRNIFLVIPFSKNIFKDAQEIFIQARKNEKNYKKNKSIFFKDLNKNEEITRLNANELYYKNKENSIQINFDLQLNEDKIKSTYKRVFFYKTLLNSKNFKNKFEIINDSIVPALNERIFNYNDNITKSNLFFFVIFLLLIICFLLIKIYKLRSLMIIINLLIHIILTLFIFVFLKRVLNIYAFESILIIFIQSLLINTAYNNLFFLNNSEKIDNSLIKKIFLNANKKLISIICNTSLFLLFYGIYIFYFFLNKGESNFAVLLIISAFTNFLTNYIFVKKHMIFFIKKNFLFKNGNFIKKINIEGEETQNKKKFLKLKYFSVIFLIFIFLNFFYQIKKNFLNSKYELSFSIPIPRNNIEGDKIKYNFQEILENINGLKYDKKSIYIYQNQQNENCFFNFNVINFKPSNEYSIKFHFNNKTDNKTKIIYKNGKLPEIINKIFKANYKYDEDIKINIRKVYNFYPSLTLAEEIKKIIFFIILLFILLIIEKKKYKSDSLNSLIFLLSYLAVSFLSSTLLMSLSPFFSFITNLIFIYIFSSPLCSKIIKTIKTNIYKISYKLLPKLKLENIDNEPEEIIFKNINDY